MKGTWLFAALLATVAIILSSQLFAEGQPASEKRLREGDRASAPASREVRRDEGRRAQEVRREGEGRRGEEAQSGGIPRDLADMAKELGATDAQMQSLKEKVAARTDALAKFRADNEAKYKEAEELARKAAELRADLAAAQKKIADEAAADIMAVFTPEQLAKWEVDKIIKLYVQPPREEGASLILTNEQKSRIEQLAADTVKDLLNASASQPAADAARKDILNKLQQTIYNSVLEPEQRNFAPKPPGAARGGEEGGK